MGSVGCIACGQGVWHTLNARSCPPSVKSGWHPGKTGTLTHALPRNANPGNLPPVAGQQRRRLDPSGSQQRSREGMSDSPARNTGQACCPSSKAPSTYKDVQPSANRHSGPAIHEAPSPARRLHRLHRSGNASLPRGCGCFQASSSVSLDGAASRLMSGLDRGSHRAPVCFGRRSPLEHAVADRRGRETQGSRRTPSLFFSTSGPFVITHDEQP